MPAFTAIFQPAMPDETSINLFYTTDNGHLAVALKKGTDGIDPDGKTWAADNDDEAGTILSSSELASGSFRGFNMVVAVTKSNHISIVSPVSMKIASTSSGNTKVAFSQSDSNAWIYFVDGTIIKEFNKSTAQIVSYPVDADVASNSSLAGWYDPSADERFVIYQEKDRNNLKEFNVITRATQSIANTADAQTGTSIAVTAYEGKVYCYYADALGNVRRVTKSSGQWGSSEVVRDCPPIGDSQIAAVSANGMNHIFYMPRDKTTGSFGPCHLIEQV